LNNGKCSQRYPLSLTLADPNAIPNFDNLYLDMNGIIHACSHPNDDNVHFRLTEETLFLSMFKYIDHLVRIVRPTGVFLLAVDGNNLT
jgi:5'-3' exoribonuclease 1